MELKRTFLLAIVAVSGLANAQNVLVWSTGNSGGATSQVAADLMASGAFSSVTGIDDDTGMTQPFLDSFDRVLYFSNTSSIQDPTTVGNLLGNFASSGKRLVLATFSWADQGNNTLAGSILNYSPFAVSGSSLYTNVTIGSTDGSAFWNGVNSIDGFFHDDVALANGATLHGSWSDGSALLASNGEVVGVNLFPDASWGSVSGDYNQLFVNALSAPVPEPATMVALGALLLPVLRRRRTR